MIREITAARGRTPFSNLWFWAALAYSLALLASATAVGMIAGIIGSAVRSAVVSTTYGGLWIWVVAVLAFAYGMRELGVLQLPMPQVRWQVPAEWSAYGKIIQAILYGAFLGGDVFTFIPYATFYFIFLLEATLGPTLGATLGFIYGFARVLSLLVPVFYSRLRWRYLATDDDQIEDLENRVIKISRSRKLLHIGNGMALLVISLFIIGTLAISG